MSQELKIFPSIMAVNYAELGEQVREADAGGADGFHLDIMDGHFVPNLTFGLDLVKNIRPLTNKEFDAHLMVTNPKDYIVTCHDAGVDHISIHAEIEGDICQILSDIKSLGMTAGLVLNPDTAVSSVPEKAWGLIDRLLIMTVYPGYGGQKFIDQSKKIFQAQDIIKKTERTIVIQVDGGVNVETAPLAAQAGAQILVAGSAVFQASVPIVEAIASLRFSDK